MCEGCLDFFILCIGDLSFNKRSIKKKFPRLCTLHILNSYFMSFHFLKYRLLLLIGMKGYYAVNQSAHNNIIVVSSFY